MSCTHIDLLHSAFNKNVYTPIYLNIFPPNRFNPDKRCSAEQALAHPYVADFHNPEDEPSFPEGLIKIAIDDNTKLSAADYRERLYREIGNRRKEMRKKEASKGKRSSLGSDDG